MKNLNPKPLRIFTLPVSGETETVAAYSMINAIKVYCEETGCDLSDFDDDGTIVEVPQDKWDSMFITNTEYNHENPETGDKEKWSFSEAISGLKTPQLIATSVEP